MPAAFQDLLIKIVVGPERLIVPLRQLFHNVLLIEGQLELEIVNTFAINDVEVLVEHPGDEILRAGTRTDRKLIEDALIFVQLAQLRLQWLEQRNHLYRLSRLPNIPDLHV